MGALQKVQKYHPEVQEIRDARKNLTLEITPSDCTKGTRLNPTACAVALALMREKGVTGVIAARSTAYLCKGQTAYRYIVPESVSRELISFDRGGKFMPGIYQLKKPWAGNTLSAVAKRGPHPTKKPGSGIKKAGFISHSTDGIRVHL